MSKKLFICGTPLQSLIIEEIIKEECLSKEECILFFYTYLKNEKYDYYFDRLSSFFSESIYFVTEYRFPQYAIESKKIFSRLDYGAVYFAAAHSSLVLLALSAGKHSVIHTFDDGLANIYKGPYARKYGLTWKKFLGLGVFGNRYSLQRIRRESKRHYTIYPDSKNYISDNLYPVRIFSEPACRAANTNPCAVIFGTVFETAFKSSHGKSAIEKIANFSKTIHGDVVYLPHPRSQTKRIEGCITIESPKISEEIVSGLYSKYGALSFYGFCSSAQIHVSHLCDGRNYLLTSSGLKTSVDTMKSMARNAGVEPRRVIDLDEYLI